MKTFKGFLYAMAFAIALGSAYASASSTAIDGYKQVGETCEFVEQCDGNGSECRDVNSNRLHDIMGSGTACGTPLSRSIQ